MFCFHLVKHQLLILLGVLLLFVQEDERAIFDADTR